MKKILFSYKCELSANDKITDFEFGQGKIGCLCILTGRKVIIIKLRKTKNRSEEGANKKAFFEQINIHKPEVGFRISDKFYCGFQTSVIAVQTENQILMMDMQYECDRAPDEDEVKPTILDKKFDLAVKTFVIQGHSLIVHHGEKIEKWDLKDLLKPEKKEFIALE
jgi:hypothetical protein